MTFVPLLAALAIQITGAWSRPAVDEGVVYATIRNTSAKAVTLVGASSPIAKDVELHQSMTMRKTMNGMTTNAVGMRPVGRIAIPAHGALTLQPGGSHLMLMGLHRSLAAGQRFPITLRFAGGGTATVTVKVENRAL